MDDESSSPSTGAITPDDISLVLTCGACPEQYDAYATIHEVRCQVGYLRLRHGSFTVDFPDYSGEQIFSASPHGDGCFFDEERDYYLGMAKLAICNRLNDRLSGDPDEVRDLDSWRRAVAEGRTLQSASDWIGRPELQEGTMSHFDLDLSLLRSLK